MNFVSVAGSNPVMGSAYRSLEREKYANCSHGRDLKNKKQLNLERVGRESRWKGTDVLNVDLRSRKGSLLTEHKMEESSLPDPGTGEG